MATSHGSSAYKECQRNHAMRIGLYSVDGCCEFMRSGEGRTPVRYLCAACGCHRSFHRKDEPQPALFGPNPVTGIPIFIATTTPLPPPPPPPPSGHPHIAPASYVGPPTEVLMGGGEIEEEAAEVVGKRRKRGRTRFMTWQREKMREFAEKLGWRIGTPSDHDDEIVEFCSEVEITPQIFKVWVKNNKKRWAEGTGQSSATPSSGV